MTKLLLVAAFLLLLIGQIVEESMAEKTYRSPMGYRHQQKKPAYYRRTTYRGAYNKYNTGYSGAYNKYNTGYSGAYNKYNTGYKGAYNKHNTGYRGAYNKHNTGYRGAYNKHNTGRGRGQGWNGRR